MTTLSLDLVLHGLPPEQELDAACHAQIAAMGRHWRLIIGARSATRTTNRPDRISVLERIYRGLDLRIFGQGQWKIEALRLDATASAAAQAGAKRWHVAWNRGAGSRVDVECLCLEFEGLPMAQLEQAVRLRLGNPGGTLSARVWRLHGTRAPTLLVVGKLYLNHKSLHRSVASCAAKVSTLLKSAIARIDRVVSAEDCGDTPAPTPLSARAQLLRLAGSVLTRLWWRGQWQIEVLTPNDAILGETRIAAVLRPPDSAFWADPFLLCRGQRRWLLFEELSFETNRGEICMVEIDGSGQPTSAPRVVLSEPWHLSYPFLWLEGERLYMIPEAGQTGELTLYEAVGDGMQWQRRAALISGPLLADATVVRLADRLWMFATCADHVTESLEDALHIYWADQIEGPWHPHALNPVKIDATCSRPAGSMHVVDGKLHRPVMDCSSTYGGRVRWMRVSRLTEYEFEEHPAPSRLPNRDLQAEPWHTFNAIDNIIVIDRFVRLARWRTR